MQSMFSFITDNIVPIIYIFVGVELFFVISIYLMIKKHELVLVDVCSNLLKGFFDAPDQDSRQSLPEKIEETLEFIKRKSTEDAKFREEFSKNARSVNQRPFYSRHYKIETFASVMSTIVQIFPLLGILGTILAIAQTSSTKSIDVESLSSAFVLAMDTTILGIGFSIIFMVIESFFWPKIERVINESNEYRKIVSDVQLTRVNDAEKL